MAGFEILRPHARTILTVLNSIIVLQPVSTDELKGLFPDAESALAILSRSRRVRKLRNGSWVPTAFGLSLGSTTQTGRKRDILRMFHLVRLARRR